MVMLTGVVVLAVKLVPLQEPSSIVIEPVPMAVSFATVPDEADWDLANC